MNVQLVCIDSVCPANDLRVENLPAVIGRSPDADVQLQDEWVSRTHCLLTAEGGQLRIHDLGSRHGTFVNGEQVVEAPLQPGDTVGVGLATFRIEYGRTRMLEPAGQADRRRWWALAK